MNPSASLWMIFLPVAASPCVYLFGRVAVRLHYPPRAARWVALIVLSALWLLFGWTVRTQDTAGIIGTIALRLDGVSLLVTSLILTLASISLVYAFRLLDGTAGEEKFYAALIVMTGAMIGLTCTTDLFNLWLWFELMTVSSFLLVMFRGGRALEAGVKYLAQSAIGSALVLVGIALVLMHVGSFDLAVIARSNLPVPALMAAGALFVVGFGVKIALVPFHSWLPDAHSQAPANISALLSGVVIEVALIALLRVLTALNGAALTWANLLFAFGIINMLAGNLLALRQTDVKRLLAYSSISQVGYMLVGFGISMSMGTADGARAGFFLMVSHGLAKGLAFLAAGALLYALNRHVLKLDDLSGAARRYPLLCLSFTAALFSLSGFPPLAGFMGKWQLFTAGFFGEDRGLWLLMAFAALNSLIALGYYLPMVNRMYRETPVLRLLDARPLPLTMTLPIIVLAVALIVFGVFPDLLDVLTDIAAAALMSVGGG